MKYYKIFIVIFILSLGLLLRLYKLNSPIADWHSFRQVDTQSVTQIYATKGFDFLHPKYFDISSTQSGKENSNGYRMVEAPIYNTLSLLFHYISNQNLEISSRLVSIIMSLGSGLLIFLFVLKTTNQFLPSIFSLFIFIVLPFNVYYSRTTLPEPTAVFFMMLALYLFSKNIYFSGLSLAISIIIKPYTAIILFPTLLFLTIKNKSNLIVNKNIYKVILFGLISLVPFILWRLWISQYPEGIPVSNWLLNNGVTTTFPNWYHGYDLSFLNKLVAFRPHWWFWLFNDRLGNLILGIYGIIPIFLGLAYQRKYSQPISISLIIGILLYFIFIAQGNIQHDYYQTLIIPSLSIISGLGYYYIYQIIFKNDFLKIISIVSIFCLSTYFSYERVIEYYKINNQSLTLVGQKAKELLPNNSLVIAPYNGDTTLLYQTGFSGWPIELYDIDNKIKQFPNYSIYLISVNFDKYTNDLISKNTTIFKNQDFIILKISK